MHKVLLCLPLALLAPQVTAADGDAKYWLQKLNTAISSLNYEGTFVFTHEGEIESMHVLHGHDEGGVRERLVSLTGEAREVIRDRDVLTCVWPSMHSVVVESSRERHGVPLDIPTDPEKLSPFYKVKVGNVDRVAGIQCRHVEILPQDAFRYGRRFCIATDTGMLLRASTLDQGNKAIESVIFTSISFPNSIPSDQFEPKLNAQDYTWHTVAARDALSDMTADPGWSFSALPPGFMVKDNVRRLIAASREPVQHIIVGDGLVAVSVFIGKSEPPKGHDDAMLRHKGAMHALRRVMYGHQITVVGEVPDKTVDEIASSLQYAPASAKAP